MTSILETIEKAGARLNIEDDTISLTMDLERPNPVDIVTNHVLSAMGVSNSDNLTRGQIKHTTYAQAIARAARRVGSSQIAISDYPQQVHLKSK